MDTKRTSQTGLPDGGEIAGAELPAQACAAALDAVAAAFGVSRGWIQRVDEDGVPRIVNARGVSPGCRAAAARDLPWPADPEAAGACGIAVVEAAAGAPGTLPEALRADGLGAAVFVPAVACGRLLGALVLLTAARREWSADERRVLEGIARLVAGVFAGDRARDRLEGQLLRAQRLVSVGRLAGVATHDFNNMLAAMVGCLDLVAAGLPPGAEEQGYVAQALEAADEAGALARLVLAFARRRPAPPAPQNLNALLDQIAPLVRRLLPGSMTFVASTRPDPVWVLADAGEVELAIMNLTLRARDASREGGMLSLSVIGTGAADPACAGIEAVNTGEGLDALALRRALEPAESAGRPGQGMELSVTAALVRASGGRVEADLDEAGGTRVRALWPVTLAAE